FLEACLRRRYKTHVRELESLIWDALSRGPEGLLDGPRNVSSAPVSHPSRPSPSRSSPAAPVSAEALEAALVASGWRLDRAWRDLGLSSRYALWRLMRRHGVRRPAG